MLIATGIMRPTRQAACHWVYQRKSFRTYMKQTSGGWIPEQEKDHLPSFCAHSKLPSVTKSLAHWTRPGVELEDEDPLFPPRHEVGCSCSPGPPQSSLFPRSQKGNWSMQMHAPQVFKVHRNGKRNGGRVSFLSGNLVIQSLS